MAEYMVFQRKPRNSDRKLNKPKKLDYFQEISETINNFLCRLFPCNCDCGSNYGFWCMCRIRFDVLPNPEVGLDPDRALPGDSTFENRGKKGVICRWQVCTFTWLDLANSPFWLSLLISSLATSTIINPLRHISTLYNCRHSC